MDTVGRRLLKGTTKETARGYRMTRGREGERDKFASIWRRGECQTRVTMSAHFICILINSTRNSIVARPSLWHLPYHPSTYFPCILPAASAAASCRIPTSLVSTLMRDYTSNHLRSTSVSPSSSPSPL